MYLNQYRKSDINFVELKNSTGLKVVLTDLGASVFQIYFNNDLLTRNVSSIDDYKLEKCYYGKTIGRTANRIKGNKVIINNKTYELEANEEGNTLHGGRSGLSNKIFKYLIKTYERYYEVLFIYYSKHLESGYPGNLNLVVTYRIYNNKNQIDILYDAISDMDTLLSLTNHTYFTLGDSDISDLELKINAHKYLAVDPSTLLPLEIKDVNKVMDFSNYKKIIQDIDDESLKGKKLNGYDSYFYFDDKKNSTKVSIKNKKHKINIYTDFEGAQIYTSNYLESFPLDGNSDLRNSVAIEPSDSFYKPKLLSKDRLYHRFITYLFIR